MAPTPRSSQQAAPQPLLLSSVSMVQIHLSPLTPTAGLSVLEIPPPVQPQQRLKGVKRIRQKLSPALLYVLSTAQFFDIVNSGSVTVAALPIAQDLNFTATEVLWILNAYTVTFAGLLLFAGRLGDLFGHRRVFMFGLFWFALWALIVSFSTSSLMFILARALQGIGAACTIPSAMALIATNHPAGPARTKAFAIFGAFGGLGAITGILLAGGLVVSIGWAWIFRVSAIAAFLLLGLSYFVIPGDSSVERGEKGRPRVDFLGALTGTLGVTGIVYYISTGVGYGWASPKTLPVLVASVLLLAAFLVIEARVQSPLMPLRVWKVKSFTTSVVLAFVSMAKFQGIVYYSNMVFQEIYQWTPIQTALGFLVHALFSVLIFPIIGQFLPRLPLKPLILTGFLLRSITALMLSFVTKDTSYFSIPFPAFILHVFGMVFSLLPLQITAIRDAENQDQGLVGALFSMGLQLGGPFGIAILNVIAISVNGNSSDAVVVKGGGGGGEVLMKGFRVVFFAIVGMGLFAFLLALVILPWDKPVYPCDDDVVSGDDSDLQEGEEEGEKTVVRAVMDEREAVRVLVIVGEDCDDASSVGSRPEWLSRASQDLERGHRHHRSI